MLFEVDFLAKQQMEDLVLLNCGAVIFILLYTEVYSNYL